MVTLAAFGTPEKNYTLVRSPKDRVRWEIIMSIRNVILAVLFGIALTFLLEPFRGYFVLVTLPALESLNGTNAYVLLKFGIGPLGGAICSGVICIFLGILVEKRALVLGMLAGAIGAILLEVINATVMSQHVATFLEGAAVVVGAGIGAVLGHWLKLRILAKGKANAS